MSLTRRVMTMGLQGNSPKNKLRLASAQEAKASAKLLEAQLAAAKAAELAAMRESNRAASEARARRREEKAAAKAGKTGADAVAQVDVQQQPATLHEQPAPMVADELIKLASLRDAGVLSTEEFEVQKRRLLS